MNLSTLTCSRKLNIMLIELFNVASGYNKVSAGGFIFDILLTYTLKL